MRSLHDLYDSMKNIDYLTLFYLFANCEPTRIKEVMQDKKWINSIDEEIKVLKKNDT